MIVDFSFDEFKKGLWGTKSKDKCMWIEWVHRNLSENHCPECLALDKCWFCSEKHPRHPHHQYCHCLLENIPYKTVLDNATAVSAYSKFDPYLFNTEGKYPHNKEKLFNKWGYTVSDSKWLQKEIEKQGREQYVSGNYELGKLDKHGQHISVRVKIARKDKSETVSFITGWMICPKGKIQLITPYGGE